MDNGLLVPGPGRGVRRLNRDEASSKKCIDEQERGWLIKQ